MNKKGQTLVEFIIILPVFLLILFYVIDFGRIIYTKNKLENNLNEVVFLISNNQSTEEVRNSIGKNVSLSVETKENYKIVYLTCKLNLIAPGFNVVLSDPYEIKVSRVVHNET